MQIDKTKYWAKSSGETLLEHSLQVVTVSKLLCALLPFSSKEREFLSKNLQEIAALHDIGKATVGFQKMVKYKISWEGKRHEILSAAIASKIAPHLDAEKLLAIITHHKSIPLAIENTTNEKCLPDNQLPFLLPNLFNEMLKEIEIETLIQFLNELKIELGFDWQLSTLNLNIADFGKLKQFWLSRKVNDQLDKTTLTERKNASILRGLLITSDHLASAGETNLPDIPVLQDYNDIILRKELKGKTVLPFQKVCGSVMCSAILKAPTGSGKTLGMLLWASNNQSENGRFFYTLPYTASINAMHQRLSKIFCSDSVGVLHSKNTAYLFRLLEEEHSKNAEKYAKDLSSLAREMYFPIKVLTPHQILRVALRGKGWELGLIEFQNACFVFDEIHAFEPKIVGLITSSAKWLQSMGAKILFASATLPKFLEDLLVEELKISQENIVVPDSNNEEDKTVLDKKRHKVSIKDGNLIENLENIIDDIQNNVDKTFLIICNYVATSQEFAQALDKNEIEFCLLHARFNSEDRFQIEEKITSKNPPRVLVATQAVEVSLDIDYDCGYTEPAPIDALAQRFGRINRKGEREPAKIIIFEKQSNENSKIYDPKLVEATVALLKEKSILSEQDLVDILNEVYKDGYKKGTVAFEKYNEGLNNDDIKNFDKNIIAGTYRDWIECVIEKTDEQVEVLPESLVSAFKERIKNKEFIKAKSLLVPVRIGQFHKVLKMNLVYKNDKIKEYVVYLPYSNKLGLDLKGQIDYII